MAPRRRPHTPLIHDTFALRHFAHGPKPPWPRATRPTPVTTRFRFVTGGLKLCTSSCLSRSDLNDAISARSFAVYPYAELVATATASHITHLFIAGLGFGFNGLSPPQHSYKSRWTAVTAKRIASVLVNIASIEDAVTFGASLSPVRIVISEPT